MSMTDMVYPLCIKCLNCKIKKNLVSCKMSFFKNRTISTIITLSALDFNCESFEGFEVEVDVDTD